MDELHNTINKNIHLQKYGSEKDSTKYQTLPFSRFNNNNLNANKKELQNARFSEAPPDYQVSFIVTNHFEIVSLN
jgi:hypothetical protein